MSWLEIAKRNLCCTCLTICRAPPNRIENYNNYLVKNKVFVSAVIKNNKFELADTLKLLEHYGKKALGIKVYLDTFVSGVINIEPLKEVCCYAKDNSLKVMVHTTNSPVCMSEIVSVLNKGDIITHAYHGGKNNASFNDFECLKTAKQKGVIIDAGFAGNVHTDFAVFKNAVKNGCLPDTISTDITKFSAYKRGGKYGMTMCMEIAKQSGMSEEAVFQSVTSNPAKVLGKDDEWGYISIGRCADVSVFTQNGNGFSLADSQGNTVSNNKCYECVLTVCNGEIVYKA